MAPPFFHVHGGELPQNSGINRERRQFHRLLFDCLHCLFSSGQRTHAQSSAGHFLRDFQECVHAVSTLNQS